jgi:hypothetical protein
LEEETCSRLPAPRCGRQASLQPAFLKEEDGFACDCYEEALAMTGGFACAPECHPERSFGASSPLKDLPAKYEKILQGKIQ